MNVKDKILGLIKFDPTEGEFYDDEDGYLDEEETPAPAAPKPVDTAEESEPEDRGSRKAPALFPTRKTMRRDSREMMNVCVIKPKQFEESREITETLLQGRPVVLNLEGLDVAVAQRILDFTSGSAFAIGGNLQKISHYMFIITPATVDISGDIQESVGANDPGFGLPM